MGSSTSIGAGKEEDVSSRFKVRILDVDMSSLFGDFAPHGAVVLS